MHSLSEVAFLLGCRDPRRITKCMQIAGIDPQALPQPPQDKRVRLLSDAQLEQLRTAYAHLYGPKHTDTSDLAARVAALEATIEQLREHSSWLFNARSAGSVATADSSHSYEPPRRQMVTTASHTRTPARPPVPPHLMSLPTWVRLHSTRPGTVKHWRDVGKLPVERGQWLEDGVRIDTALTFEGRMVAHQLAHLPWPCEKCMAVEEEAENETTPAHAVVEVARPD